MATIRTQYFAMPHFGNVLPFVSASEASGVGSTPGCIRSGWCDDEIGMLERFDNLAVSIRFGWLVRILVVLNAGFWLYRICQESAR